MTKALDLDRPARSPAPAPARRPGPGTVSWAVGLVALLGLVERLWLASAPLNGDEGVHGVMTRAFAHGDLSTFVWGQQYGGTLEIFSTVPTQWLLGNGSWALHLPQVAWSAATALVIWRIALRLVTPSQARWAAGLWWVAPVPAVAVQTMAYMFYSAATITGLLVVLFTLRIGQGSDRFADKAALGVAFGLAWWQSPTALVYFAVPAALWMLIEHRQRIKGAIVVPGLFALLAAVPWLVANVDSGFMSFVSDRVNQGGYLAHVESFFTQLLPAAFGVQLLTGEWVLGAIGLLFFAGLLAVIGVAVRRAIASHAVDGLAILVYPFALAVLPTLLRPQLYRYVIFLIPFVAICVSRLITTRAARLGAVAITTVLVAMAVLPGVGTVVQDRFDNIPSSDALVATLTRTGHTRGFAPYSAAYPVIYETDGDVVLSPLHAVRSKEIDADARSAARPVFVFPSPAPYNEVAYEPTFRRELRRIGVHAERIDVDGFHIYVPEVRTLPEDVFEYYRRALAKG